MLGVIGISACIETGLVGQDKGNSGTVDVETVEPVGAPNGEKDCLQVVRTTTNTMTEEERDLLIALGYFTETDAGSRCDAWTYDGFDEAQMIRFNGRQRLTDVSIYGTTGSATPNGSVRLVALVDWGTPPWYDPERVERYHYPYDGNYFSYYVGIEGSAAAAAIGVDWVTGLPASGLGTLNDCADDEIGCIWTGFVLQIWDEARALDDRCGDFIPDIWICPHFDVIEDADDGNDKRPRDASISKAKEHSRSADVSNTRSSERWQFQEDGSARAWERPAVYRSADTIVGPCQAGSGDFQLVGPRGVHGSDTRWWPIQSTGPSPITDDAVVLRDIGARLVAPQAPPDSLFGLQLLKSPLINPQHSASGMLSFAGLKTLWKGKSALPAGGSVRLTWDCPSKLNPLSEGARTARGYSFSLDGINCVASWTQKLSARPVSIPGLGYPTSLELQLYGQPGTRAEVPLRNTEEGGRFSYEYAGLSVRGLWTGGIRGAPPTLALEEVSLEGLPLCAPGDVALEQDVFLLP